MEKMIVQKAKTKDLFDLLNLYTQLHDNPLPEIDIKIEKLWNDILADKNHYVIIGKLNNKLVASCVLIIVPNLTHQQKPYALIENVITHDHYRNKGYATQLLNYAKDISKERECYKIMLMTGSKKEITLNFYKRAGYNSKDKTAFIQWL